MTFLLRCECEVAAIEKKTHVYTHTAADFFYFYTSDVTLCRKNDHKQPPLLLYTVYYNVIFPIFFIDLSTKGSLVHPRKMTSTHKLLVGSTTAAVAAVIVATTIMRTTPLKRGKGAQALRCQA
jgi:hypothetical protein